MTINDKVDLLRSKMKEHGVDAIFIPTNDPHQSEYPARRWKARKWISGFKGSAGTAMVALDHAGLWTDGRYYLQAEEELAGTYFELHKHGKASDPSYVDWVVENVPAGGKVSIAGNIFSIGQMEAIERKLKKADIGLVTDLDLVSDIWTDQPDVPRGEVFVHEARYAGESREDRIGRVRREMIDQGADYHLVNTLDDIAWIFNIRGSDVECNPVAVSYAIIGKDGSTLYIYPEKVPAELKAELEKAGVTCKSYDDITGDLNKLPETSKMLIDPSNCSVDHYRAINAQIIRGGTISRAMKAIKNDTEIALTKNVMVKDGIAVGQTFYWLDKELAAGNNPSEAEFSDKLAEHRSGQENYVGESFAAIIGYKGNGAIIHYRPWHDKCARIKAEGILLADSGGQYLDGTTDITRTVALGTPTAEQKRNWTLVLKGHIELARAVFPEGTTGGQLDTLARMHLWSEGLNYAHGTGHGVGHFLNVHEPPQGFAPPRSERASTVHKPGMYSSNEPGFYKEGEYGIRLENLVFTVEAETPGYLKLDTVTLYPFDTNMVDRAVMTDAEIKWYNDYQNEVWEKISPHIDGDFKEWFRGKCQIIE